MFVSIPSRGFWFFEGRMQRFIPLLNVPWFQSPRGDFGFLKARTWPPRRAGWRLSVSIPSRGFWFFEANTLSIANSSEQ